MAAPEVEVPDFDDGQKAVESFRALCEAVADANAAMAASGQAGSFYPQTAPEPPEAPPAAAPPPEAPPAAAPPPAAEWAAEPQLTPQQPSVPPPWWAWRQRQHDDAWEQQAEEWQAWQEDEYYTTAAPAPVSSEISHWNCVRVGITKHPGGPWEVMFKIRPVL